MASLGQGTVAEAAVGADGPLFAVGSHLHKAWLSGVAERFREQCLLKGGVGSDDLLDGRKDGCFEMGGFHGVGQELLPAGTVHRHSGELGLAQKIQKPPTACPGGAAVDGFHEDFVVGSPDGDGERYTGPVRAELDARIKPALQLGQGGDLQLLPFGFADSRFLVIPQPEAEALDVEVNGVGADFVGDAALGKDGTQTGIRLVPCSHIVGGRSDAPRSTRPSRCSAFRPAGPRFAV